jgi:hypothetical protein
MQGRSPKPITRSRRRPPVGHTNTFGADPFKTATTTGSSVPKSASAGARNTPRRSNRPARRQFSTSGGALLKRPSRAPPAVPSRQRRRMACFSTMAGLATTTAWRRPTTSPGGWPCTVRGARATMPPARWMCRGAFRGRWFIPACNGPHIRALSPRRSATSAPGAARSSWNTSASSRKSPSCGRIPRCWSRGANRRATSPSRTNSPAATASGTHYMSALHFRQHLNELQHDYVYLAPDQILSSDILRQYPVLFLPFTVAISRPPRGEASGLCGGRRHPHRRSSLPANG